MLICLLEFIRLADIRISHDVETTMTVATPTPIQTGWKRSRNMPSAKESDAIADKIIAAG